MSRKYAMTKIGKGDWLIPSNDATKLFRIVQVDDVDNDKPVKVWSVYVYTTPVGRMEDDLPDDFLEWERWREVSHFHRTREAALDDALGVIPEKGTRLVSHPDGTMSIRLW